MLEKELSAIFSHTCQNWSSFKKRERQWNIMFKTRPERDQEIKKIKMCTVWDRESPPSQSRGQNKAKTLSVIVRRWKMLGLLPNKEAAVPHHKTFKTRPSSDSEAATMYKLAFYNLHLTYCTLDGASYILHKFLKFMFQKSLKNLLKKSLKHKMKNLSKL